MKLYLPMAYPVVDEEREEVFDPDDAVAVDEGVADDRSRFNLGFGANWIAPVYYDEYYNDYRGDDL